VTFSLNFPETPGQNNENALPKGKNWWQRAGGGDRKAFLIKQTVGGEEVRSQAAFLSTIK